MDDLTFQSELQKQPIDVLRLNLLFARGIAYPHLELQPYLDQVDELAEGTRRWIPAWPSGCQAAELLGDFLFTHQGFRGNSQAYSDPRNSYLNEVLERRLGIPISLSALYIAVARRLDIPAQGIGLPGHFIVRVGEDCYLDPYHGGERLSQDDCARLVEQSTGVSGPFNPDWLKPVTPQATLTRMLNNLRNAYLELEDWSHALSVIEHLRMLHPQLADLLRDQGHIYYRQGLFGKAAEHYRRYLSLAPEAADADKVQRLMQSALKDLAERN